MKKTNLLLSALTIVFSNALVSSEPFVAGISSTEASNHCCQLFQLNRALLNSQNYSSSARRITKDEEEVCERVFEFMRQRMEKTFPKVEVKNSCNK